MPPFPGEERLVTVFADIHYYFTQPTVHPTLHRFDKASYFYIYHNATRQTSRIEVANHPGTQDQDAFNGYLNACHIQNFESFPTRLTITVDALSPRSPTSSKSKSDPDEWTLPAGDLKTRHRIHTIDAYFWAVDDAQSVIECLQSHLAPEQLDVAAFAQNSQHQETVGHGEHQAVAAAAMSPVVQNLEKIAVTDTYDHRHQPRSGISSASQQEMNIPPPPPPPLSPAESAPVSEPLAQKTRQQSISKEKSSISFTPMAYNPAAPAAPEPIKHREKTPPPEDGVDGTGLDAAMRSPNNPNAHFQNFSTNSVANRGLQAGPPPPSSLAQGHHASTVPPQYGVHADTRSSIASTGVYCGSGSINTAQDGSRLSTAAEHYIPGPPLQSQPVETPGTQFYSTLPASSGRPLQHVQPHYADYLAAGSLYNPSASSTSTAGPVGGYSSFDYGAAEQRPLNEYDVHNQVYRPTEAESNPNAHRKSSKHTNEKGRTDSSFDKLDKGVGRLFKKLEKRVG